MTAYEILARGSAFIVHTAQGRALQEHGCHTCSSSSSSAAVGTASSQAYGVLTASHIVAPWRWPKYYPMAWLQYVKATHTKHVLEVRDHASGETMYEALLLPTSRHHKYRDVALLRLDNEVEVVDTLMKDFNVQLLGLSVGGRETVVAGTQLIFHGHKVVPISSSSSSSVGSDVRGNIAGVDNPSTNGETILSASDDRVSVPLVVSGIFRESTSDQGFAATSPVLVDGMCGGPVIVMNNDNPEDGGEQHPVSVGLIEGVGSGNNTGELEGFRGLAVFVDGTELQQWTFSAHRGEGAFYDEI